MKTHLAKMSTMELLNIEPVELKFPFEVKKQISCSLQLSNKTESHVAFKVKTTNPKKYCVRPNTGIVLPRSTCDVIVTMQAQKEAPPDMQCKDKFLLQSIVASPDATPKDITAEMFVKAEGRVVEECKLRVIYVSPPQPPSPVAEGSEEGASPKAPLLDNGNSNASEHEDANRNKEEEEDEDTNMNFLLILRRLHEHLLKLMTNLQSCDLSILPLSVRCLEFFCHWIRIRAHILAVVLQVLLTACSTLLSKLTEEKAAALQRSNKLRQELRNLEARKQRKSKWCSFHVRDHCWLGWHHFGVSHEEDIIIHLTNGKLTTI
ncbi:unnamed protein product [Camellia sinensis]